MEAHKVKTENSNLLVKILAAVGIVVVVGAVSAVMAAAWFFPLSVSGNKASAEESFTPAVQTETTKAAPITVRGIGKISAKPDTIVMNVGVSAQESTVKAAQAKVTEVIEAMTARLKAANVSDADYRTTQYNVEPVMDYSGKEGTNVAPTLLGFRITSILEITVRDVARGPELLDTLTTAGANTIYGVTYTFADPEALTRQAYNAAIQDAEARASKLAGLSNLKLGEIIAVSEASAAAGSPYYGKEGLGGGGAGLYPGQQQIQSELLVTYEGIPAK